MFETWTLAVFRLTNSSAPISPFDRPSITSRSTSNSRIVRPNGSESEGSGAVTWDRSSSRKRARVANRAHRGREVRLEVARLSAMRRRATRRRQLAPRPRDRRRPSARHRPGDSGPAPRSRGSELVPRAAWRDPVSGARRRVLHQARRGPASHTSSTAGTRSDRRRPVDGRDRSSLRRTATDVVDEVGGGTSCLAAIAARRAAHNASLAGSPRPRVNDVGVTVEPLRLRRARSGDRRAGRGRPRSTRRAQRTALYSGAALS